MVCFGVRVLLTPLEVAFLLAAENTLRFVVAVPGPADPVRKMRSSSRIELPHNVDRPILFHQPDLALLRCDQSFPVCGRTSLLRFGVGRSLPLLVAAFLPVVETARQFVVTVLGVADLDRREVGRLRWEMMNWND